MDMTRLPPDFGELLKLLNSHGVKYLVIGGWALVAHGYNRPTQDFDIWIEISPENARKVRAALDEFIGLSPSEEEILKADKMFRMGVAPYRLEILPEIAGVSFDECYASRIIGMYEGIPAPVIDLQNLIKNKIAAGRDKDIVDVGYLKKIEERKKAK